MGTGNSRLAERIAAQRNANNGTTKPTDNHVEPRPLDRTGEHYQKQNGSSTEYKTLNSNREQYRRTDKNLRDDILDDYSSDYRKRDILQEDSMMKDSEKAKNLRSESSGFKQKKEETIKPEFTNSAKISSDDFSDIDELARIHNENKKQKQWKLSVRIINIVLIIACVYVVFLIGMGVPSTDYHYNEDGKVEPQVLSVSDMKEKKSFEEIKVQYEKCRVLYEKTLMLDYRLGQGEEDPLAVAPEYEKLLDDVTDLSIKTDALTVDSEYSQIKEMLLSWIKNDIAIYLQCMSSSISENNTDDANKALIAKDSVYNNFSQITSNMMAMGSRVKGEDMTDIKEWSPEKYVEQEVKGVD